MINHVEKNKCINCKNRGVELCKISTPCPRKHYELHHIKMGYIGDAWLEKPKDKKGIKHVLKESSLGGR